MLEYKLYQRDIKLEFKWNYRIQKTILEFRSIWRLVLSTESNIKIKVRNTYYIKE